jgi:hypothetical protein
MPRKAFQIINIPGFLLFAASQLQGLLDHQVQKRQSKVIPNLLPFLYFSLCGTTHTSHFLVATLLVTY